MEAPRGWGWLDCKDWGHVMVPSHKKGCQMVDLVRSHYETPLIRNVDGTLHLEYTKAGLRVYFMEEDIAEVVKRFKKRDEYLSLLRKVLRPGLSAHCSRCAAVWEKLQRVEHENESCEPVTMESLPNKYYGKPFFGGNLGAYYAAVSDLTDLTAASTPAPVPLVSDEELMAKVREIQAIQPTSIKKLHKILKAQKPEWLVTETRLKKLLKP
jgi:hypothetical protein